MTERGKQIAAQISVRKRRFATQKSRISDQQIEAGYRNSHQARSQDGLSKAMTALWKAQRANLKNFANGKH
jgi:hypothetical protein